MSTPKRQHTVPRLHLRHFVGRDPEGHVWSYESRSGRVWSATPENTAVESHFYSAERTDGTMDTAIEEHLSKIESLAAPVYSALLRGEIPDKCQERANFAHFLSLMYARTGSMRRVAAESYGRFMQTVMFAHTQFPDAFDTVMRRYEQTIGHSLTAEQREAARRAMADPSGYEFEIPKERTFTMLASVADELAKYFFSMNWSVHTLSEGYLITSDNPIGRAVDPGSTHPIYGDHGFLNKTIEVTFPLSPSTMLLMTWKEARPIPPSRSQELAHVANSVRAAQSERFVYAHVNDARIAQLATEFRDSRADMKISGLRPENFGKVTVGRRRGPS